MFNKMFNSAPKNSEHENTKLKENINKKLRSLFYGSMLVSGFFVACAGGSNEKGSNEKKFDKIENKDSTITKSQFIDLENVDRNVDSLASKLFKEIKEKKLSDSITYNDVWDESHNVIGKEAIYHYKNWNFSGKDINSRDNRNISDANFDVSWSSKEKNDSFPKEGYEYQLSGSKNDNEPVEYEGQIIHYINPEMTKESALFSEYYYFFNKEKWKRI